MARGGTTGLFGKLPAHGDFVRRGLPRSFIGPWDDWLSAGIEASRHDLGPAWDRAWELAPAWRFRLAPGACGPDAAVGVVVTSADTVGRRFPLTLAAVLPSAAIPPPDAWFDALEAAAWQGRAGDVDADGLLTLLPAPPPDDPDATLDGRSLFWTAGALPLRMPSALNFARLLVTLDLSSATEPGLPLTVVETATSIAEASTPFAAFLPAACPPADFWDGAELPFIEDAAASAADGTGELLWLDPADGPGDSPVPGIESRDERAFEPSDQSHAWAETVELPWAAATAPPVTDPSDPEAGAAE